MPEPAGLDKDLVMNILWANIKTGSVTQPPSSLSESRHSVRMKGNDLSPHCDAQQSELDQGECLGYISGVADSMSNIICIPPDVETGQLLKVATKYMCDNPAELHHDAATIVFSAFEIAFPCK